MPTLVPNTGVLSLELLRNITPSTGALWFELTKGFPTSVVPAAQALSLTGYVSPQLLTLPSPLNAQVGIVGAAPVLSIGIQTKITPSVGALGFLGIAPNFSFGSLIIPSTVNATFAGKPVTVSLSISGLIAATGTLNLVGGSLTQQTSDIVGTYVGGFVGAAPTLKQTFNITPSTGAMGATGQPEQSGLLEIPNVGALLATGYVPTWNLTETLSTGTLSFSGQSVGVGTKGNIMVQTGVLGLTGFAPVLLAPVGITPNTGSIGASGAIPTENLLVTITVNIGGATFTGNIPQMLQVAAIVPQTGTLGFLGVGVQSVAATLMQPGAGSMQLSGQNALPSQQIYVTAQDAVAMIINGNAPIVMTAFNIAIGTGSMGLASDAGQSVVPQFKYPGEQDMFINSDPAVVTMQGPPDVDEVPVTLLQNSVRILFLVPGSNGMSSPGPVLVTETNSLSVLVGPFLDINGVAYIPQALAWLLWDDTNKIQVQGYSNLTPDFSVTFEIPGNLNVINNPDNLSERRLLQIQTTLPGGEVRTDPSYYNVLALPDLGP